MTARDLEKYSSACTLSDMEIFIFPELLYSLVLANILSPEIWRWRRDPWFRGIGNMAEARRVHRVKQYIMDHYDFNLDLETWGLTDKETEISRFREFIDPEVLRRSNALFGYEGDRYYFDMDIRRHFGLDKYDTDIIPYWKTETVEAMHAFRFKPDHQAGAGECVSLAALYAAALFVVARIPLERIFLMGTPLHSQNFIQVDDGILTNNRRIVTRTMWYNGSELSALARRALEHEQVTIVAHSSGFIHSLYPEATIDPEVYRRFREHLTRFLNSQVDYEIFINFLRTFNRYQKRFQLAVPCRGSVKYLPLEKAFGYEHGSKNRLGDKTARKLLCEIGDEDFFLFPFDDRATLNEKDPLFRPKTYPDFIRELTDQFPGLDPDDEIRHDLKRFVHTVPRLPVDRRTSGQADGRTGGQADKWTGGQADRRTGVGIAVEMTREEILAQVTGTRVIGQGSTEKGPLNPPEFSGQALKGTSSLPLQAEQSQPGGAGRGSPVFDLALYAGRYMDYIDWMPFLKAALERNPVSIAFFLEMELQDVFDCLLAWPGESIYEGNRLALPDEVVNFTRGDGIEKALTLANVIRARARAVPLVLTIYGKEVFLDISWNRYTFPSNKKFNKQIPL